MGPGSGGTRGGESKGVSHSLDEPGLRDNESAPWRSEKPKVGAGKGGGRQAGVDQGEADLQKGAFTLSQLSRSPAQVCASLLKHSGRRPTGQWKLC